MAEARFIVGDVFETLAGIPDQSVDLVLTSPPFLALRSYLPADHPDKAKEIGSEATPGAFIDTLLRLTEEWARVLTPHGSIAVELGDTYSCSGGAGGDYNPDGLRDGQPKADGSARRTRTNNLYNTANRYSDEWNKGNTAGKPIEGVPMNGDPGWPLAKSLCLIPELYRISLVYGFNPLTGRETPRWRARNVVRWCRPNPPVGALGDKFRPATSEIVVACQSGKRWFDLDAVRAELTERAQTELAAGGVSGGESYQGEAANGDGYTGARLRLPAAGGGAPPLDWWEIPTQPYKGAHYATWPEALCVRPIEAMCPRRVCRTCGKASERITEPAHDVEEQRRRREYGIANGKNVHDRGDGGASTSFLTTTTTTLGWSDCGHDNWRPGVVLDPFAGSGTTLAVAVGHGRDAIGIDFDARNADLAHDRVGMFLTVEENA